MSEKSVLEQNNFKFNKKFGQNFIFDKNLLNAIINDSGITKDDDVLEIGPGAGTLTRVIAEKAKKVVSYEIDTSLQEHLLGLNLKNTKFVFGDVMNFSIEEIEKDFKGEYKLIANLPYYITTPIIFKFLNNSKKIKSLTIMVQKEVAERIVAKVGGKDYGVLSIMCQFYGEAKINRIVSRKMFFPQPNVDSAVVTINIDREKFKEVDYSKFYNFIKCVFSMRRKTLRNNLAQGGFSKEQISLLSEEILSKRSENFDITQLLEIYLQIFNIFKSFC